MVVVLRTTLIAATGVVDVPPPNRRSRNKCLEETPALARRKSQKKGACGPAGVCTLERCARSCSGKETSGMTKEEERDDLMECAPSDAWRRRQGKVESELVTDFARPGRELEGGIIRRHPLAVESQRGFRHRSISGRAP